LEKLVQLILPLFATAAIAGHLLVGLGQLIHTSQVSQVGYRVSETISDLQSSSYLHLFLLALLY
jgi:hypothetical protein